MATTTPEPQELLRHEYLTIPEAAAIARVHHDTVRRAIAAGRLRAGRPSGNKQGLARIHRDELHRWLAGEL